MLIVQVYDQMDVFVIDDQIRKFAMLIGAYRNVIFLRAGQEQSRRVRVSLLRPIFRNDLSKRFLVFGRNDHDGNSWIQTQVWRQDFGIEDTNLLELLGDAARGLFTVVAQHGEMRSSCFHPGFLLVSRDRRAPKAFRGEEGDTTTRDNAKQSPDWHTNSCISRIEKLS